MRSTRPSSASEGFSVLELLVAITIVGIVLSLLTALFATGRKYIQQQILRIETDQAIRATLESLARDLRLSGACLPQNGDFLALDGSNQGTTDSILTRTGLVEPNLTCVRTATRADVTAGAASIPVESVNGFVVDMGAYIRHPDGSGETFVIASVTGGTPGSLGANRALSRDYPWTSGVYAIDERRYAIDTTNPALPVLTVARNGLSPVPFAYGLESLNVEYELARNCPPCDRVDLPATEADWALVNRLIITVTGRSRTYDLNGAYYRRTRTVGAKPRNLLPN
jgi:prepilin-type N-terminal cleavage/methylation domain-containing protein